MSVTQFVEESMGESYFKDDEGYDKRSLEETQSATISLGLVIAIVSMTPMAIAVLQPLHSLKQFKSFLGTGGKFQFLRALQATTDVLEAKKGEEGYEIFDKISEAVRFDA